MTDDGFTLIEVLLATLLFSILIGMASWGYSQYLRIWESELFADVPEMTSCRRLALLRRSIEGVFDYYVKAPESDLMVPFFEANPSGFIFVTRCPVFSDAEVAVAQVRFEKEEGVYRLRYVEEPLIGTYLAVGKERLEPTHTFVAMDGIRQYEIAYFGLSSEGLTPEQLAGEVDLRTYQWTGDFSGAERGLMPAKVDIQLVCEERVYRFLVHLGEGCVQKGLSFNADKVFG
jgi:prepilin-type N-terminal cleavage/methylation domain-containing protein